MTAHPSRVAGWLLVTSILLACPAGHGQPHEKPWNRGVSADQRAAAEALFIEANILSDDGFYATAVTKYDAAIDLWPHPAFYYNRALILIDLDLPVQAYKDMEAALAHGPTPLEVDPIEARKKHVEGQNYLKQLDSKLATLEVHCDAPGAEVTLNGNVLFVGPGRFRDKVRVGLYQLSATRPGYQPDIRQIVLTPGSEQSVELILYDVRVERRWSPWKPWAVFATGLAAASAGAVLHWQADGAVTELDRDFGALCSAGCRNMDAENLGELVTRRNRANNLSLAARLTYAGASLAVVTGSVLLLLNRKRSVKHRVGDSNRVSLIPMIATDTLGMQSQLRF